MDAILIERVKGNSAFLSSLLTGLSALWQSGVFEILRSIGRVPAISPNVENYSEVEKTFYAWSLGYNDALDDLIYFKEKYLEVNTKQNPLPDYGGLDEALRKGDLTKEEVDGIRRNESGPNSNNSPTNS